MAEIATKGTCPVCTELVTVRKDGLIRSHGYLKDGHIGPKTPCPGTDQVPRVTSEHGSFSALCAMDDNQGTQAIVWVGESWVPLCARHAKRVLK